MTNRIGIIGAGAMGLGAAALLAQQDREVRVWSPRRRLPVDDRGRFAIRTHGAFAATVAVDSVAAPEDLADCTTLLIAVPATAYADVLPRVAASTGRGQHIIVGGALSFAPLGLHEALTRRGIDALVSGWGTTLTTGRIEPDGRVEIGTLRGAFPMAAVPASRTGEALAGAGAVFGRAFEPATSILEITLSNINPVAHAGQVLANLSRIERREPWQLFACFTPAATRIVESIDRERRAIAAAFGLTVRSLAEHYRRSYHVDGEDVATIAAAIHAAGRGVAGPVRLDHRYVLEDVPFGLVAYEMLATIAGVATPALTAAITLMNAAYARDFRRDNPLLPQLFPPTTLPSAVKARCQ